MRKSMMADMAMEAAEYVIMLCSPYPKEAMKVMESRRKAVKEARIKAGYEDPDPEEDIEERITVIKEIIRTVARPNEEFDICLKETLSGPKTRGRRSFLKSIKEAVKGVPPLPITKNIFETYFDTLMTKLEHVGLPGEAPSEEQLNRGKLIKCGEIFKQRLLSNEEIMKDNIQKHIKSLIENYKSSKGGKSNTRKFVTAMASSHRDNQTPKEMRKLYGMLNSKKKY